MKNVQLARRILSAGQRRLSLARAGQRRLLSAQATMPNPVSRPAGSTSTQFEVHGYTPKELAVLSPEMITPVHVMAAVGLAGEILTEHDFWRERLQAEPNEEGKQTVDVETPEGLKQFNLEPYQNIINVSKQWARLTRVFVRYNQWVIGVAAPAGGGRMANDAADMNVVVCDIAGTMCVPAIFDNEQKHWITRFIPQHPQAKQGMSYSYQTVDGMTLMSVLNEVVGRQNLQDDSRKDGQSGRPMGKRDVCLAIHPFAEEPLSEWNENSYSGRLTDEQARELPPFQVFGPLLDSLLTAGEIVQLEQMIWSLVREPDKIMPEMITPKVGPAFFTQWCYWVNSPALNPSKEPGLEASVTTDVGPDNVQPTPTVIGNLLLDAVESNINIDWVFIPQTPTSITEHLVWTVDEMQAMREKYDIKRAVFKA